MLTDRRAIAIPIGETILVNGLLKEVPRHTHAVAAKQVIAAGATKLRALTEDPHILRAIQTAFADAVVATLYLALAAACASLPFAVLMEWKSVKVEHTAKEENALDDREALKSGQEVDSWQLVEPRTRNATPRARPQSWPLASSAISSC